VLKYGEGAKSRDLGDRRPHRDAGAEPRWVSGGMQSPQKLKQFNCFSSDRRLILSDGWIFS